MTQIQPLLMHGHSVPQVASTTSSLQTIDASNKISMMSYMTMCDAIRNSTVTTEVDHAKWTREQQQEVSAIITLFRTSPHRGVDLLHALLTQIKSKMLLCNATHAPARNIYTAFDMFLCGLLESAHKSHSIGYIMLIFYFSNVDCEVDIVNRATKLHVASLLFGYCAWYRPMIWEKYDDLLQYPRMTRKPLIGTVTGARYNISHRMPLLKQYVTTPSHNDTSPSTSIRVCVNCSANAKGWPLSWTKDRNLVLNWCQMCYLPILIRHEHLQLYHVIDDVLDQCDAMYTHTTHTENTKLYLFAQVVAKTKKAKLEAAAAATVPSVASPCLTNCAIPKQQQPIKRMYYQLNSTNIATAEESDIDSTTKKRKVVHFDTNEE